MAFGILTLIVPSQVFHGLSLPVSFLIDDTVTPLVGIGFLPFSPDAISVSILND
jgi:hypothetical protein